MTAKQFEALVALMKAIADHAIDATYGGRTSQGDCVLNIEIKEAEEILVDQDDWQEMI